MSQAERNVPAYSDDHEDEFARFCRWLATVPNAASALAQLRAQQQLTLQEVADLTGLSKPYIDRLERGLRTPERDTLVVLLLSAFSLSVAQANRILLLAGYAPLYHERLARSVPWVGHAAAHDAEPPPTS